MPLGGGPSGGLRSYSETFTVEDDGKVLVASKGGRYQRSDCP